VQIQMRFDPDSGMILIDLGDMHVALHPRDALAMCSGLSGLVSQIPALQPQQPQIVIAGQIPEGLPPPNFGGRLNGR
jgi:hypothetical protein